MTIRDTSQQVDAPNPSDVLFPRCKKSANSRFPAKIEQSQVHGQEVPNLLLDVGNYRYICESY